MPLFLFVVFMPRVKAFDENDVLNKAMHLFWKQGYAATSIQDLVSHLGINRASLYTTFGDKEQLFKKAFQLYRSSAKSGLEAFFKSQPNVKEGLSLLFENAIEEAITDPDKKGCFVVNTTTELIPNDEKLIDILEIHKKDIEAIFYTYLKEGKASGQLQTTLHLKALASLLYTLYNGIRVVSKVRPDKKALSDSVAVALSLLNPPFA